MRQDAGVVVEKKKDEVSNTDTYLFGEEYEIISNTIILIESIFVNDICNAQKKDLIIYELDNEVILWYQPIPTNIILEQ